MGMAPGLDTYLTRAQVPRFKWPINAENPYPDWDFPSNQLERETRLELATPTLAR